MSSTPMAVPGRGGRSRSPGWFVEFMLRELAPYPGRGSMVARMVIATTFTMIVINTFHVPGGALGGFFALIFSRQNLSATVKQGVIIALFFTLGTVFVIATLAMLLDSPVTHFLWVIAMFYLAFFVMATAQNYAYATGFAFTLATAIPLWDRPGDVNAKVAGTLYTLLSVAIGAGVTIAVETVYRIFRPADPITLGVADRLRAVASVLRAVAEQQQPDAQPRAMVLQYAALGSGTLRQQAVRAGAVPQVRARATAAISLSDRVVQLASLVLKGQQPADAHLPDVRQRLLALTRILRRQADILAPLTDLNQLNTVHLPGCEREPGSGDRSRILAEMERTVQLMSDLFQVLSSDIRAPGTGRARRQHGTFPGMFKGDAFRQRGYQLFALRGCIAATCCYLIYNGVDWPGISTALATCIITALGTIGASRQKQFLRILGAFIGGVCIALPAQVYLLPNIDSITAFTVFFAVVMCLAGWISTASPRLSYMGLQLALAFDLVNLQEPFEQISLGIARDRVVGVLLGLVAMWIVFDQIGGKLAGDAMKQLLEKNLRSLAELAGALARARSAHSEANLSRVRFLIDDINDTFTATNGQADGIVFEFDRKRARHLRDRETMLAMQPPMRSILTVMIAIYEAGLPGSSIRHTHAATEALARFLTCQQRALLAIAENYAAPGSSAGAQHMQETLHATGHALDEGRGALHEEHPLLLNLCVSMFSALRGVAEAEQPAPDIAFSGNLPAAQPAS